MASFLSVFVLLLAVAKVSGQNPVGGICPSFPVPEECPPEPDNQCENDNQCSQQFPGLGLKCCKDGCDLRCVPPIPPPTPEPQRVSYNTRISTTITI
ncbi:antileukoproteinase-like [Nematostella vectensis]|uniref:antileukoproteinase-like n=1 Tax=Nematostella vectensis TaxID=45351 RepID=UPI00207709DB|nr:antileukoproteinase-like [Nematostella vectensis]